MALVRRFRCEENDEYGMNGWLLVGAPTTYKPLPGMAVAHDILEHQPNDNGSVEHELLALGAALYLRGEGGYWSRKGGVSSPGENMGGEIGGDLGITYEGLVNGVDDPGRTKRLDDHVEEWIQEAVRGARQEIKDRSEGCNPSWTSADIRQFLLRVPGWLRRGYRLAAKRYKGLDTWTLSYLFEEIEKNADNLLKEDMASYCEMVVSLNLKRASVRVYLDESNLEEEY